MSEGDATAFSIILGTYKLDQNENLDAFYAAAGVPWVARKFMTISSPTVYVTQEKNENEEDVWLIKTVTFTRTINISFKLDESFEETLPSGDVFVTTATIKGTTISLQSKSDDKGSFSRDYEFSEDGLIMTLKHQSGVEAKRYFKRA